MPPPVFQAGGFFCENTGSTYSTRRTQVALMRVVWRANALQEPFFSPPGAGVARAWWRKKDLWGDNGSPNPSLRNMSYFIGTPIWGSGADPGCTGNEASI